MVTRLSEDTRQDRGSGTELRARLLEMMPVGERRLELAGIPTAVLEGGDGPPVVLLHGHGEFAATWMRTIPALARNHRVVVPDLPGHGASGVGDEPLDSERVLAWLRELTERTCDGPPVVVGHLLGGAIAARFAAVHGDRLSRLVLVDSLGLSWYLPEVRFALAMVGFVARPTERSQDRLFRRCMLDLDGVRAEMDGRMELLEAYALDRARTPELKSALQSLMPRFAIRPIPDEVLERIPVPVTLIWGREDRQVSVSVGEAASERHGWPLHVIDDAADDPAIEQPEAFLAALRTAMDEG